VARSARSVTEQAPESFASLTDREVADLARIVAKLR
jgi:hypothetical protein